MGSFSGSLKKKKSHKIYINHVTPFEGVQKLYKDWMYTGKYPWLNRREGGYRDCCHKRRVTPHPTNTAQHATDFRRDAE